MLYVILTAAVRDQHLCRSAGLERNSDKVVLASYAPLFVNINDQHWDPDMIVFNGTASYGTPSYWVARLFSQSHAPFLPSLLPLFPAGSQLAASAVCTTAVCTQVNIRLVNMLNKQQTVQVRGIHCMQGVFLSRNIGWSHPKK